MAIGVQHFTNIDTSTPASYPNGQIKDDITGVSGTPVNRQTWGDMVQFFDKLLRQVGLTANNTPESETNGYQYIDALYKNAMKAIIGNITGAWTSIAGLYFQPLFGGTGITIDPGDIVYHRYVLIGETMIWQLQLNNITVTGSPAVIVMNMNPSTGATYANAGQVQVAGVCESTNSIVLATLQSSGLDTQVHLTKQDGTNFVNGTNSINFFIEIRAELN